MILDHHQVTGLLVRVETAARVGQEQHPATEPGGEPDAENQLGGGVALVAVQASAREEHVSTRHRLEQLEAERMAFDAPDLERQQLGPGERSLQALAEVGRGQAGTGDDHDLRSGPAELLPCLDGLVEFVGEMVHKAVMVTENDSRRQCVDGDGGERWQRSCCNLPRGWSSSLPCPDVAARRFETSDQNLETPTMNPEGRPTTDRTTETRPSIFDRLELRHPAPSQVQRPQRRPRPLLARRARGRRRLWVVAFCCLVFALFLGAWYRVLTLPEPSASPAQTALDRDRESLDEPSPAAEASAVDDALSAAQDPSPQRETVTDPSSAGQAATEPVRRVEEPRIVRAPPAEEPRVQKAASAAPAAPAPSAVRDSGTTQPLTAASVASVAFTPAADESGGGPSPAGAAEPSLASLARQTLPEEVPVTSPPPAPVFQPAVKLSGPQPRYPPAALAAGREATVLLEAQIDAAGKVVAIETLEAAAADFVAASRRALSAWTFEPARLDGLPAEDRHRVRFRFETPEAAPPSRRPIKIASPLPTYPASAWAANTHGEVELRVLIDRHGAVDEIEVVKGLPNGLNEAAIAAVERWKFKPALQNGEPVAAYEHLTFRF